jgi:hypothetical protein
VDIDEVFMPSDVRAALQIRTPEDYDRVSTFIKDTGNGKDEDKKDFTAVAIEAEAARLYEFSELIKGAESRGEFPGAVLAPGASLTTTFNFRAPAYVLATKEVLRFSVICYDAGAVHRFAGTKPIRFQATRVLLLVCGGLGAVIGWFIRAVLGPSPHADQLKPLSLVAAACLGVLAVLVSARRSSEQRGVVVEDVCGAILVGAGAGLFTDDLIKRLKP